MTCRWSRILRGERTKGPPRAKPKADSATSERIGPPSPLLRCHEPKSLLGASLEEKLLRKLCRCPNAALQKSDGPTWRIYSAEAPHTRGRSWEISRINWRCNAGLTLFLANFMAFTICFSQPIIKTASKSRCSKLLSYFSSQAHFPPSLSWYRFHHNLPSGGADLFIY